MSISLLVHFARSANEVERTWMAIAAMGPSMRIGQGMSLVASPLGCQEIVAALRPHTPLRDGLLGATLSGPWAVRGVPDGWLREWM